MPKKKEDQDQIQDTKQEAQSAPIPKEDGFLDKPINEWTRKDWSKFYQEARKHDDGFVVQERERKDEFKGFLGTGFQPQGIFNKFLLLVGVNQYQIIVSKETGASFDGQKKVGYTASMEIQIQLGTWETGTIEHPGPVFMPVMVTPTEYAAGVSYSSINHARQGAFTSGVKRLLGRWLGIGWEAYAGEAEDYLEDTPPSAGDPPHTEHYNFNRNEFKPATQTKKAEGMFPALPGKEKYYPPKAMGSGGEQASTKNFDNLWFLYEQEFSKDWSKPDFIIATCLMLGKKPIEKDGQYSFPPLSWQETAFVTDHIKADPQNVFEQCSIGLGKYQMKQSEEVQPAKEDEPPTNPSDDPGNDVPL